MTSKTEVLENICKIIIFHDCKICILCHHDWISVALSFAFSVLKYVIVSDSYFKSRGNLS